MPTTNAPATLLSILALLATACVDEPTGDSSSETMSGSTTGESSDATGEPPGSESTDADPDSSGGDGPGDSTGQPEDAERVTYFHGVSENFLPDGTPTGSDELFARRELDPEGSQILEVLYLVHPDQTWERFDLVQSVDLEASTFTSDFTTDFGTLEVEGEFLSGDDWEWNAWRSRSVYIDGVSEGWTVESDDQVLDDGSHEADKQVFDPEGTVVIVIEERAEPIDQEEYEMAVAELE